MSLRLRLTLLNGFVLLLAVSGFAAVSYVTQAQALERDLDQSLRDQAREYNEASGARWNPFTGRPEVGVPNPNAFAAPAFFIQVTDNRGEVFARSRNLADESIPSSADMFQRALNGDEWLSDVLVDDQPLRLYVAPLRITVGSSTFNAGMIQVARPLSGTYAALNTMRTTFLLVGAGAVLLSLVMGWLLARTALRPIDRLADTAHAIGRAQDFGRRVPLGTGRRRDEVGRLAEQFNLMLERLQDAYGRLESALAAQRRFVADASHELRTPLTSLRGNVGLLRRMAASGRPEVHQQEGLLADMASETERMARLVADLLLLAQADAGQHLVLVPTPVVPIVRDAFRTARFLKEGVELRLAPLPNDLWIEGDADRLKQLLLILLDNALKYTDEGGTVTIGAERSPPSEAAGGGVSLRVTDTGRGIPPSEQARIWERFYRSDPARAEGGAGLGLAIARWIAEEHGGEVHLESHEGGGSTFTVWLPAISAPAPDPELSSSTRPPAAVLVEQLAAVE